MKEINPYKFKVGDHIIKIGGLDNIGLKGEIDRYHGMVICRIICDDGFSFYSDINEIEIDKQHYREERLKKLLK